MRILVVLACLVLAACDQISTAVEGLSGGGSGGSSSDMLRPRELQTFLESGMVWCYNFDASNQTCAQIEVLSQVDSQGFSIYKYYLLPLTEAQATLKVQTVQRVRFAHEGDARGCSNFRDEYQTMRFYEMLTTEARLSPGERALPDDLNGQLVNLVNEERMRIGASDEMCFGWRISSREPWGLVEVDYIDGVAQPQADPTTVRLFPIGSNHLRLRAN